MCPVEECNKDADSLSSQSHTSQIEEKKTSCGSDASEGDSVTSESKASRRTCHLCGTATTTAKGTPIICSKNHTFHKACVMKFAVFFKKDKEMPEGDCCLLCSDVLKCCCQVGKAKGKGAVQTLMTTCGRGHSGNCCRVLRNRVAKRKARISSMLEELGSVLHRDGIGGAGYMPTVAAVPSSLSLYSMQGQSYPSMYSVMTLNNRMSAPLHSNTNTNTAATMTMGFRGAQTSYSIPVSNQGVYVRNMRMPMNPCYTNNMMTQKNPVGMNMNNGTGNMYMSSYAQNMMPHQYVAMTGAGMMRG